MHELIFLANKAFGFTPEYTLWQMTWANITAMFKESSEFNIRQREEVEESRTKGSKKNDTSNLGIIPGIKITDHGNTE